MSEHKPLPVYGYKPQSEMAILTVNDNKVAEEQILRVLDEMQARNVDFDPRWCAIARTQFEMAFMAMNRAVMKPERIKLPEDTA